MVPSGTVLTYQAKIAQGGWASADEILSALNSFLMQNNIKLADYHNSTSGLVSQAGAASGLVPFTFQSTMTLQTRADFGAVSDIQAIVDHGIYLQVDNMPVSSIPNVSFPKGYDTSGNPVASGLSTDTGQPVQNADISAAVNPGDFFSNLFSTAENSVTFLFLGIILAVILIIGGKHKGVLNI